MVNIELVYISADQQTTHLKMSLPEAATVADALHESGLMTPYPEIAELQVGIFTKPVERDRLLKNGDRLEIYRPLLIDPKQKRRDRAKGGKSK